METATIEAPETAVQVTDFADFAQRFFWIKSKRAHIIPFRFDRPQADYHTKRTDRNIILKARQIGFSTYHVARILHWALTEDFVNCVIVAQKGETSRLMLDMVRTLYEHLPARMQPPLERDSEYQMTFPETRSAIRITSPTKDAGRSQTIQHLYLTELAFWDNADEACTGLFEAADQGTIDIDSTPCGLGGLFHRLYVTAQSGESRWTAHKYDWSWVYSQEWADAKLRELGAPKFAEEYGCDFLQSGRPVFETEYLLVSSEHAPPTSSGRYVIGADPAEGLAGGDFSSAVVLERETGREVAALHGLWPPDVFASKLAELGKTYNEALIGVERNNHGHAVILQLRNLDYPNVYRHRDYDATGKAALKAGWPTTSKTKPIMIDDLEKALRLGEVHVASPETLEEMRVYQYEDSGSTNAPEGYHDDRVMSLAIAWQLITRGYQSDPDAFITFGDDDEEEFVKQAIKKEEREEDREEQRSEASEYDEDDEEIADED